MAFLGGYRITGARWVSQNAITVAFETSNTGMFHQLYSGRTLIGVTASANDREVTGQLVQTTHGYEPDLSLVAVDGNDVDTDHGSEMGVGPFNRALISFSFSGLTGDEERADITAGTQAGGAVSSGNVLGSVPLSGDGTYTFLTDPLAGSGTWNFEVTPYDDRDDDGNAGTARTASLSVIARPPDVQLQTDGTRLFDVSVAGQVLSLSVVLP